MHVIQGEIARDRVQDLTISSIDIKRSIFFLIEECTEDDSIHKRMRNLLWGGNNHVEASLYRERARYRLGLTNFISFVNRNFANLVMVQCEAPRPAGLPGHAVANRM